MKKQFTGLFLLLVIFSAFVAKLLSDAGLFKAIKNHGNENCVLIQGVNGAEDFAYSKKYNKFFISSDERPNAGQPVVGKGRIYLLDPETQAYIDLTLDLDPKIAMDFHPHGVSIWEDNKNTRLFVISHRKNDSTIELFDYDGGHFSHVQTIEDALLINPNDIAATGFDSFYTSHDHGSAEEWKKKIEDFSRIGRGYVTYYEPKSGFRIVANGINFANGLILSQDLQELFVASTLSQNIMVFTVQADHTLGLKFQIPLGTGVDNITFDDFGNLWIAAHPKIFDLKAHSENHLKKSPTQVLRIMAPITADSKPEEVLLDDGNMLSASSVAYRYKDTVFLGSIFDTKLAHCQIR